jgi:hypothetical protein
MSNGKAVADEFFTLDRSTIEGLIERGFLAAAEQHDMDSLEKALQAFLRYEFGGKRPANLSPAKPIVDVPQSPPVATVIVSADGQRALNELVLENILISLVKTQVLTPLDAVGVLDEVIDKALKRQLYGGAVEGARFARESLLYELGRLGLVSR